MTTFTRSLAACLTVGLGVGLSAVPASAEVSSTPSGTSPSFNAHVRTIEQSRGVVYVGGDFTSVDDASGTHTRNGAAAFSLATGRVLAWNPNVRGSVNDLVVTREGVYLGGDFDQVWGRARSGVALVRSTSDGRIRPSFNHDFDGAVNALSVSKTRVYVGGTFTKIDDRSRGRLAAFRRSAAHSLTDWRPRASSGQVKALEVSGDGVYVAGGFVALNGRARFAHLGLLRTSNGRVVRSFHPGIGQTVLDVAASRRRLYVAVGGDGGGWVASLTRAKGARVWRKQLDGDAQTVALMRGRVYVGGHFSQACTTMKTAPNGDCLDGSAARARFAALTTGGRLTSWAPVGNSINGVSAMLPLPRSERLLVGGDFTTINGSAALRFARFNAAG